MILEESEPGLEFVGYDAGGGDIYNFNGEPFTGVIVYRHLNGNRAREKSFVNGYTCGAIREYNQNGILSVEYFIKLNIEYGQLTTWDENGNATIRDLGPEP